MKWSTELATPDARKWGKVCRIEGVDGDTKAVLVGHHVYYPRNWILHMEKPRICKVLGLIAGDEDGTEAMAEAERMIAKGRSRR